MLQVRTALDMFSVSSVGTKAFADRLADRTIWQPRHHALLQSALTTFCACLWRSVGVTCAIFRKTIPVSKMRNSRMIMILDLALEGVQDIIVRTFCETSAWLLNADTLNPKRMASHRSDCHCHCCPGVHYCSTSYPAAIHAAVPAGDRRAGQRR